MAKRMSKTLAAEIADRTMTVVNPANRGLTLNATLQRHGFTVVATAPVDRLVDRTAMVGWLMETYARAE
jgi:prolyl-tRNA editing enzyme YbaK/EbsC (Cys-tRNA(Pro) deacylase)